MSPRCLPALTALLAIAGSAFSPRGAAAEERDVRALRLVPFPKRVRFEEGSFALDRELVLEAERDAAAVAGPLIAEELERAGLKRPAVRARPGGGPQLRLAAAAGAADPGQLVMPEGSSPERYALSVAAGGVTVRGAAAEGLLHGAQTLRQLLRANRRGPSLPCIAIEDWPSLRWRAFQDDLTRGPSTRLDQLVRGVAIGAYLKLNLFTYYMEHQFRFAKHPLLGPEDGSLTAEELAALVAAGRRLGVEVLGNQQSFAHMEHVLKHPQYAGLGENSFLLSPAKEEVYKLLDDLYSEVIPLLPFPFFNVCCDETFGLGEGPSRELASRIGAGGVYVRHIQRIHELVSGKHGKRMLMWGDIILNHADKLGEVPKDVVFLTWGYHPGESFESQILPFVRAGHELFVCPGVSCWSRVLPHFADAAVNIRNFVRDGAQHGALGMIVTAWDDDGESLNGPNWHGFTWGAECAWNASATAYEDFQRRVGAALFGEEGDRFGRAIDLLSRPGIAGMFNGRFWELDLEPGWVASLAAARDAREKLLRTLHEAIEHLEACRRDAKTDADLLDDFLFGARRMELLFLRQIEQLEAASEYGDAWRGPRGRAGAAAALVAKAAARIRAVREAHAGLAKRFEELWMRENKPHALDWTLKRYRDRLGRYDALLERLDGARRAAEAGAALPAPREVGLELLSLELRRSRAHRLAKGPLPSDGPAPRPWRVAGAAHRLGLVVGAGSAERAEVPIEVELELAGELVSRPARAFEAPAGREAREVLVQLDPAGAPGRARLALLLPGPIAAGESLAVEVYLGLEAPGPRPGAAATTGDAPGGAKWIENDQVRLLLGPEGGHVYRWEVKGLGSRDLTMPGETGWAGFSDLGGARRAAPNELACTAAGPALVRFECRDPSGLVKTISLWGGASWLDVVLSEPVSWCWDYDDPAGFSAGGPSPGTYLFSSGATGPVGREADGGASQAKAESVRWGVKFVPGRCALGLVTPEVAARHLVGPGGTWGGVGIEASPPTLHLVTYAGVLAEPPDRLMERLRRTLDLGNPPEVTVHALEP